MSAKGDRTEKPTARRLKKARKKGQVPRSRELSSAASFAAVILFLVFLGSRVVTGFESLIADFWRRFFLSNIDPATLNEIVAAVGWSLLVYAGPFLGLVLVVSVLATVSSGGLVVSSEALHIKFDRLNPANNVKKVLSKTGLVNLGKSLLLASVVIAIFWQVLQSHIGELQTMVVMDLRSLLIESGGMIKSASIQVAVLLAVVAVIDVFYQRYSHTENLKMTKQEVKDDYKETEGNPQIKGKIRRMQIQMARQRMMSAVREADVVVTNPTHFAVALKFDMAIMSAPQVVAKGQDYLALRIRAVAEENRVPIVEERELARALYRSAEIGEEVPVDLYRAVAQILAYVYKLKKTTWR